MKRFKLLTLILVSILCLTTFVGCKNKNEDVKEYDYSIKINDSYTTQNIFNEDNAIETDDCFVIVDLTITNLGLKGLPIWESDFSLRIGENAYNIIHKADKYFGNSFIKTDKIRFEEENTYSIVFEIPLEKENETKTLNSNICDIKFDKEISTTRENYFTISLGEHSISTFEHKYFPTNQGGSYTQITDIYTEIKIPLNIANGDKRELTINRYNFKLSFNNEDVEIYYLKEVYGQYIDQITGNAGSTYIASYDTPQKADSKIATIEKGETYNYEIVFRLKNYEEEINLNYIELTLNDTKPIQINL